MSFFLFMKFIVNGSARSCIKSRYQNFFSKLHSFIRLDCTGTQMALEHLLKSLVDGSRNFSAKSNYGDGKIIYKCIKIKLWQQLRLSQK